VIEKEEHLYYEYWGLQKPPFDNVPDPSMYVDCHTSMENAIAETLFGIEEGNECIAVIVGDVGLGKTLSLRMIIDSLDPDKFKIALITNPSMSFIQLLREIIGQLTGKHWTIKRKIDLLETFNRILFETQDEGKRVLIFIELARRLEHPKRANLFQRIGTYSRIDKIESPELLRAYVESRIRLAGGTKKIFSDDAISALWEHSSRGIPRLINKIAKLSLKAGETNDLSEINGGVVDQIGERFKKLTRPVSANRKPRTKMKETVVEEKIPEPIVEKDMISEQFVEDVPPVTPVTEPETPAFKTDEGEVEQAPEMHETVPLETDGEEDVQGEESAVSQEEEIAPSDRIQGVERTDVSDKESITPEIKPGIEIREEIAIGQHRAEIYVPAHLMGQVQAATAERQIKMIGALAAQILQKNPHLLASHLDDPVYVWGEIRNFILSKLN
jgi:type II secretory pathway predicted ATPase ExeA